MVQTVGFVLFIAVFLLTGTCCLFLPHKIQPLAIKAVNWGAPFRIGFVNSYMRLIDKHVRSTRYLITLRLVGAMSLLVAAFMLWGSIRYGFPR